MNIIQYTLNFISNNYTHMHVTMPESLIALWTFNLGVAHSQGSQTRILLLLQMHVQIVQNKVYDIQNEFMCNVFKHNLLYIQ